MPGPGNYATIEEERSTSRTRKGFTFSGKSPDKYNQNPGPGSYDQSDALVKNQLTKSIKFS